MKITIELPASKATLTAALQGLTALNVVYLNRHPKTPALYKAGARYVAEPPGREQWLHVGQVLRAGKGDCEDLAAWRAAELQRMGIRARAVVIRTGNKLFHALVRLPDGTFEDPARKLGMKKRRSK